MEREDIQELPEHQEPQVKMGTMERMDLKEQGVTKDIKECKD